MCIFQSIPDRRSDLFLHRFQNEPATYYGRVATPGGAVDARLHRVKNRLFLSMTPTMCEKWMMMKINDYEKK